MAIPILTIVTSQTCGHCTRVRGSGILSSRNPPAFPNPHGNGWVWNETFFKALLRTGSSTGPEKLRLFEIHFEDLSGHMDKVSSFSEFSLIDEHVRRQCYHNTPEGMMYSDEIGDDPTVFLQRVENYSFYDYLNAIFPVEISDFILPYPGWIFASQYSWGRAVRKEESLYAICANYPTRRKIGADGYEVDGRGQLPPFDPVTLARDICDHPERLVPGEEEAFHYPGTAPRAGFLVTYH